MPRERTHKEPLQRELTTFNVGEPRTLGVFLHVNRIMHGQSLQKRADVVEGLSKSGLSRLENGQGKPASRPELIGMAEDWKLAPGERDQLMVAGGFIPEVQNLTAEQLKLFAAAIRELVTPGESQLRITIFQRSLMEAQEKS